MPKRNTKLDQTRNSTKDESEKKHVLCPIGWTIRRDVLASFIDNYTELMNLWDWSLQANSDAEMATSQFLLSLFLGKVILKQTDKLSKNLQNATTSAAQGQHLTHHCTKNEVFH